MDVERQRVQGLISIQCVRAAACLLVVVYHAIGAWGGDAAIAVWPNGSAGVDVFFVVSGVVMALSAEGQSAAVFLGRRLRRIVPLYWLLTTVKLAISLAAPGLTPHTRFGWWDVAASYLFIPARDAFGQVRPVLGVGWTLNFEMLFYVVFALALAWRVPVGSFVPPIMAALAVGSFFPPQPAPAVAFLANSVVLEFCLGLYVAWRVRRGVVGEGFSAALLIVGGCVLLLSPLAGPWRGVAWGLPAACCVLGAVGLERSARQLPRLVGRIGDASYAIYLVHTFLMPPVARIAGGLRLPDAASLGLTIAAALFASIAAGLAVHRWVERPMLRWVRGGLSGRAEARSH